jgi:MinD superfamily P-loop ATPase
MKEIVMISGKGGTGKTSLTASFGMLGGKGLVLADCDVDAANMHLLLNPDFAHSEEFYSGKLAKIDQDLCSLCGDCAEICEFGAITTDAEENFVINQIDCEGCGYCAEICPEKAIAMEERMAGHMYISDTRAGSKMVHARLGTGAENSGKLVARVRKEAVRIAKESGREIVLIDGSPGIGCPVISSLTGADYVIIVTEPTISGFHDMRRVYQLVAGFKIKAGCIINKYDLNRSMSARIIDYLRENNIDLLSDIPYDESFTAAMIQAKTIIDDNDNNLSRIIINAWKRITDMINNGRI